MALRPAKLIWILCCTLIVLSTSLGGAQASLSCFPSAAAVKNAYPGTWPHWTYRAHNREGAKCWYPGTQAATPKSQSRVVHHQNSIARPRPIAASMDDAPIWNVPTALGETSGTGWSMPAHAVAVDAAPVPEQSSPLGQNSFAERFSAVFEVILFERPSVMRRIEGLISNLH